MRNIIFIATACVLLSACGAYQPFRTREGFHGHPVSPADEVKGKTVRSNTVVHRRLTNARSGATAWKLTPNHKTVQEAPAAQEAFRGLPVSPGDEAGATGSKLTPIQAAQEAFRGLPVPPGDEAGATGSKLTAIQAAQEAFRGLPIPPGDEEKGTTLGHEGGRTPRICLALVGSG